MYSIEYIYDKDKYLMKNYLLYHLIYNIVQSSSLVPVHIHICVKKIYIPEKHSKTPQWWSLLLTNRLLSVWPKSSLIVEGTLYTDVPIHLCEMFRVFCFGIMPLWLGPKQYTQNISHKWMGTPVQHLRVIWGHCCLTAAVGPCLPNGPITQLSPYLTRNSL